MTLPAWAFKIAAAFVLPALVGVGVAMSAPSPVAHEIKPVLDAQYTLGDDGIDYAAVTGPSRPADATAIPACADPARRGDLRPC